MSIDTSGENLITTPLSVPETQQFQERRIDIGDKTLLIPGYVQEQMSKLDEFVAEKNIVSEVFGFGLTRTRGATTEVVDFMAPQRENIFSLDSLFINQDQQRLTDILGSSQSLVLSVDANGAAIIPNDSDDPNDYMRFVQKEDGEIDWSYARDNIRELLGFELPKTISDLKTVIRQLNQERQTDSPQDDMLVLKADWDVILSGGRVTISGRFIDKVLQRAEEIGADIGFSMHHHPNLALAAALLTDKPQSERVAYYNRLLQYSFEDVRFMRDMGVDFFEIRTSGNPDHISDPKAGITSRYYRVEQILAEDSAIAERLSSN